MYLLHVFGLPIFPILDQLMICSQIANLLIAELSDYQDKRPLDFVKSPMSHEFQ